MRFRGPDAEGRYVDADQRLGFVHRRLAIIDTSDASNQPFHSLCGRYVMVFNGEIYNYESLRSELLVDGLALKSHGDTEVIIEQFARHGAAIFPRLRGMFALAIWDNRDQVLTLARDTYGIKPLYFSWNGERLSFASQVKTLLVDQSISRAVDPAGYAGFQLWGSVPAPRTMFSAISALPAGHWMQVKRDGEPGTPLAFQTLASLASAPTDAPPTELRAALQDSVRHHLIANVEVGFFLSGGIDSASLVGLARDCGYEHLRTFTLAFDEFRGTPSDETDFARMAADLYGTDHQVELITRTDFEESQEQISQDMDQPSIDGVNTWFVSRAAHRAGLKVAMSGLGGDELMCGYSTFTTVPKMVRYWRGINALPFAGRLAGWAAPLASRLTGNRKLAEIPAYAGDMASAYTLFRAFHSPGQLARMDANHLLQQGLAELDTSGRLSHLIANPQLDPAQQISLLESVQYMGNQLLVDTDWASMAHSLEVRVPLVDTELFRAVSPHQHQLTNGRGKALLGNAPSKPLPDALLNREKMGFSIPVSKWTGSDASGAALGGWSESLLARYATATGLDLPS